MIDGVARLPLPTTTVPSAKTKDVARQFEAVLIAQLLKESREAGGGGWLGTGENDQAGQTGIEVAEQEFARMLAAKGGLGMAAMIEKVMK